MRTFVTLLLATALVASPAHADDQAVSSQVIPLANETNKCINTSTHAVSAWITSITLEKKNNWLTQTNGVGAQVDLTLTSSSMSASQAFPRAREISVVGTQGRLVRANLSFPLLTAYVFNGQSQVTAIDAPVVFLRRQGDSDVARYAKTMIKATKQLSGLIPANPFAQGVDLGGKLATAFFESAVEGDDGNATLPRFYITHSLSRTANCNANDLLDGMRAIIGDTSEQEAGVIKVADVDSYCFYRIGAASDPSIGYVRKEAGACSKTPPAGVTTLRNPQIIYLAYAVAPATVRRVQAALSPGANRSQIASDINSMSSESLATDPLMDEEVQRAIEICKSAGISREACFGVEGA